MEGKPLDVLVAIGHRCVVSDALDGGFRRGEFERNDARGNKRAYRKKVEGSKDGRSAE